MPVLTEQSCLAANLKALGERNSDLAAALAAVEPHPGLAFVTTPQGVPSATLEGRQLCSRHRPLDEADRLVEEIDLVEHAVVVVLGFGLGWHVRQLAARCAKATVIVVFEPDLPLLRSVLEQIDHSSWFGDALVVFITDCDDRGALAGKLHGAEAILAQGVEFLEHPVSRARLGESSARFGRLFGEFIASAKTTLVTTLVRSVDTVRNLMLNIDHYAAGPGLDDLKDAAAGFPAVVVSAGPSLHKNVHLLAQPGVRNRCVIIAVQTTLKPLLAAGIKPHYVTALDYHEISRRFYEDIDPAALEGVTLVAEAKAHPVILDLFPGPVRCCANGFLDKLLGPMSRPMGDLPAGATVAHLAVYLARHLGCNPIAMIGQDLGFPDGLYYAPGTAIHEVWAPELNPFNTIEMMEWQRIVRHRLHLMKVKDVHGKSIYTDAQMHTYLQQFERDFAEYRRDGLSIVDATEGGVAKQHTVAMPLREFLAAHARRSLPPLPLPAVKRDEHRLHGARKRLAGVASDIRTMKTVSDQTATLIRAMMDDQHDPIRMAGHFRKIEANRKKVEERFDAFELLNHMNQLGVFRRMKTDRRLHMQQSLEPLARQRAQLQRDLDNVTWIADAALEFIEQLGQSERILNGEVVDARPVPAKLPIDTSLPEPPPALSRIMALIPVDPERNGLGVDRSIASDFNGVSVLQATLQRVGQSTQIERIILIAPEGLDVEPLIKRDAIALPVDVERINGSPFGPEQPAIAAARLWSQSSWRGGIAGVSIYDEVLCPTVMLPIMQRRELAAALIVGPDWPLVQVQGEEGCDALIRRHLEHPQQHKIVITQSPPGLCGCLISASLMQELAQRNRLSTIGGLLVYQPHAPQGDPIARDLNVQVDHRVRQSLARATFDSPRQRQILTRAILADHSACRCPAETVAAIEAQERSAAPMAIPRRFVVELCTTRSSRGIIARQHGSTATAALDPELAEYVFKQIAASSMDDVVISFAGRGDPLLHPRFDEIIASAKRNGVRAVNVRTELLVDRGTIDRLLAAKPDVVSVDLHADRAATYQAMMGLDRFKDVLINMEYLAHSRTRLTAHPGNAAFALPWIVPVLQRRAETYEDIDTFFDRWQHVLGTAVIEGPPAGEVPADTLTPAVTPARVLHRDQFSCITIRCDGEVPINPADCRGSASIGNLRDNGLAELWSRLCSERISAAHGHLISNG